MGSFDQRQQHVGMQFNADQIVMRNVNENPSAPERPMLYPPGGMPLLDTKFDVDWSYPTWNLEVQNVGRGLTVAMCGVLLGPQLRPKEQGPALSERYFVWREPPIRPDERTRTVTMERGGLIVSGLALIGPHTLYAPVRPLYAQMVRGEPYVTARLTLTYRDVSGNKHASISDYHSLHGWQPVAFLADILVDLIDLDRQARL